jgi:chemotaxis protein methyltransferase WspC
VNFAAVVSLLEEQIGLIGQALGLSTVTAAIAIRLRARGLVDSSEYLHLIARDPVELQALSEELVVPETWFFRGGGLFTYLARRIQTETSNRPGRPFRCLSVPCSSGEEAYSLAIALDETGFPSACCTIDGIDLSLRQIDSARRGLYRDHSFRETPTGVRQRHFRQVDGNWEIDACLRSSVHFATGNVVDAAFLCDTPAYDLIFCRNLFIYFSQAARRKALTNLHRLLVSGGLLCMGHAEPLDPSDRRFEADGPIEYFLYRKTPESDGQYPPYSRVDLTRQEIGTEEESIGIAPAAIRDLHKSHQFAAALPALWPDDARRLADSGRIEEALLLCQSQVAQNPTADLYSLLGVLHGSLHNDIEAAACFEKALYLTPDHAEALLHLMLLRQGQGLVTRADLLRRRLERIGAGERR